MYYILKKADTHYLNPLKFGIASLFFLILDLSIFNNIKTVTLLFLYSALFFGASAGLYAGLWVGFLAGISSPDPVGPHMLAFSLIGHILGRYAKILKKELWPVQILIVFISALILDIFCLFFLFIFKNQHINLNILNNILLKSFYTCIASFFIFYILKKFKRILL